MSTPVITDLRRRVADLLTTLLNRQENQVDWLRDLEKGIGTDYLRIRAQRSIEVEFRPDGQAIRVLVDEKPMPVRYLRAWRKKPTDGVYDSAIDLVLEIELLDGEKFRIHNWKLANGKPLLRPANWATVSKSLWETQFQFLSHFEQQVPSEDPNGWADLPDRLYDFTEEV